MKKRALLSAAIVAFAISFASAQTPVKQRQHNQQHRIVNGVQSGELTKAEVVQLQKQQIDVQRTKRRAKADGVVTKKEKAVINHKQNNASRNIYVKKHNDRDRM